MRGFLILAVLGTLIPSVPSLQADREFPKESSKIEDTTVSLDENADGEPVRVEKIDSTVIVATRAGAKTPVTYTMIYKDALLRSNPLNSLPMTLSLQPSVVAVNEGGTGLGYSKMTIRGSKGSQTNVTLNGITLNDSESQEVFWVNIPSLSSILSSVQLQRGLGTSANGAGAFGASINMSTASVGAEPFASAEVGYGSYNTLTSTIAAGSGLTKSGVYFNAAYSHNYTDGYIRNAKANVQSALAVLGWMNENNSVKATYLLGNQHSGITWNGIDLASYALDRRYNSAGEYYDYERAADGSYLLDKEGNRIVRSTLYYDNETDNYTQHHLQLNYTHSFPCGLLWSTTANFTKGDGYYEQYKADKKFKKYGMNAYAPQGVATSDFIIRKVMDNNYSVAKTDLSWKNDVVDLTGGLSWSRYGGNHFGRVLWSRELGTDWNGADGMTYDKFNSENLWYLNHAIKQEYNAYFKAEYSPLEWLTAYVDLQLRDVNLRMWGVGDDDNTDMGYSNNWLFFNPRAGLTFNWGGHKAYFSAAQGHREPGRADIKENLEAGKGGEVRPEEMVDVEIGYEWSCPVAQVAANLYFMEYWDMLLDTGRLSDSGYPIKDNVGRAYRRGVELSGAYTPWKWLSLSANLTLSLNKVLDYTETFSICDDNGEALYDAFWKPLQKSVDFGKTTMLMSPSVVGMVQVGFTPFANLCSNSLRTTTLGINGKFVGKQYIDNTQSEDRAIPRYFVSNLSLTHEFDLGRKGGSAEGSLSRAFTHGGALRLGFYINNLFNNFYYADGAVWSKGLRQSDGADISSIGIFPQAPINFMFKVGLAF